MAKVDLSGVTSGSFGYLREHFWDLAKVSLLPVLLCAVCFSISGYFSFVQLKSLTEGSGDFALNWIGFYFGLLPDFLVIWLWVRVVKFVYNDGAGTFEIRPSELKSSLFAILYLLAALIPFAVLWIVMAVVIAVAAGGHVSGVIGLSLFVLIPATMVFALWYFARVSVSIVPVANGSRPNLFSQFVQASAGNN